MTYFFDISLINIWLAEDINTNITELTCRSHAYLKLRIELQSYSTTTLYCSQFFDTGAKLIT